eukprot:6182988-Pleurochrysis_carterae.AAC.5
MRLPWGMKESSHESRSGSGTEGACSSCAAARCCLQRRRGSSVLASVRGVPLRDRWSGPFFVVVVSARALVLSSAGLPQGAQRHADDDHVKFPYVANSIQDKASNFLCGAQARRRSK